MVRRWEDIPPKEHRVLSFRKLPGKWSVPSEGWEPLSPMKAVWWLCVPRARASSGKRINGTEHWTLFSRTGCLFFSSSLRGLSLLQNFNLLAFLLHQVKFLLRFFLSVFSWLVSRTILFILGSWQVQVLSLPLTDVEIIVYRFFFVLSDLEAGNLQGPFHSKLTCMPVVTLANQKGLRAQTVESSGGWNPSFSTALADWPEIWA